MSETNQTVFPGPPEKEVKKPIKQFLEEVFKPKIYQHCLISFLNSKRIFSPEFIDKIREFYDDADAAKSVILEMLSDEDRQGIHLDCKKGCHYCCGLTVKVAMPELYIIFEHLLKTHTQDELTDLQRQLSVYTETFNRCETREEKIAMPCTFLKDGVCSIYSVRPLSCRAWNSSDSDLCRRYLTDFSLDIPTSISHYAPYDSVRKAVVSTLHVAGLQTTTEELNAGMLRLLEDEFGELS